ncbi:transposon ty3-G gag-pol polyprotein, partial [Tanacetum coccineum]
KENDPDPEEARSSRKKILGGVYSKANEDVEESLKTDPTDLESDREETTEISLHAILGKTHPTTIKINDIKITQDFHPFSLGGADLVLEVQCSKGVSVEEENISAVKSWPIPSIVKEKDGFLWSEEALEAFNDLKQTLLTTSVLRLPNFSKPFVIKYDASSDGVEAILSQEAYLVAYFSKGFSPSNRFKLAYDRGLLALVLAIQKWSHYLLGQHFLIRTDHYTFKFLLEQRITTTKQQRLLLKLMPYDFSIVHKAGKENKGADALSCRSHSGELLALIILFCIEVADIKARSAFVSSWADGDSRDTQSQTQAVT